MSRIVVSVLIIQEFLDKLIEMNDYIEKHPVQETGVPSKPMEDDANDDFPTIVYSSHLFALYRRFYFDLRRHKDGYRRLRVLLKFLKILIFVDKLCYEEETN